MKILFILFLASYSAYGNECTSAFAVAHDDPIRIAAANNRINVIKNLISKNQIQIESVLKPQIKSREDRLNTFTENEDLSRDCDKTIDRLVSILSTVSSSTVGLEEYLRQTLKSEEVQNRSLSQQFRNFSKMNGSNPNLEILIETLDDLEQNQSDWLKAEQQILSEVVNQHRPINDALFAKLYSLKTRILVQLAKFQPFKNEEQDAIHSLNANVQQISNEIESHNSEINSLEKSIAGWQAQMAQWAPAKAKCDYDSAITRAMYKEEHRPL